MLQIPAPPAEYMKPVPPGDDSQKGASLNREFTVTFAPHIMSPPPMATSLAQKKEGLLKEQKITQLKDIGGMETADGGENALDVERTAVLSNVEKNIFLKHSGTLNVSLDESFNFDVLEDGEEFSINRDHFKAMDVYALNCPMRLSGSVEKIATYFREVKETKGKDRPVLLCRAVFMWIATHIKFNRDSENSSAAQAFSERGASAEGIARLFSAMLAAVDVPSIVIQGHTKAFSEPVFRSKRGEDTQHYWNTAFVGSRWYLFDLPRSIGYYSPARETGADNALTCKWVEVLRDIYFMCDPVNFIREHLPQRGFLPAVPVDVAAVESKKAQDRLKGVAKDLEALTSRHKPHRLQLLSPATGRSAFDQSLHVKRFFLEHKLDMLYPEKVPRVISTLAFYTLAFRAPANYQFAVDMFTDVRPVHRLARCWHVSYTPVSIANVRRVNVNLVFPQKGKYSVLVKARKAENQYILWEPVLELLFNSERGVYDISKTKSVVVGHLAKAPDLGKDLAFHNRFALLNPSKGFFEMDRMFSLQIACPDQVTRVVVSNNERWSDLMPIKHGDDVGDVFALNKMCLWQTRLLLQDFCDLKVYYKQYGKQSFDLLYSFDRETEHKAHSGVFGRHGWVRLDTPAALHQYTSSSMSSADMKSPLSGGGHGKPSFAAFYDRMGEGNKSFSPIPDNYTSITKVHGQIDLDGSGRCFEHNLSVERAFAGRRMWQAKIVVDEGVKLQANVMLGWERGEQLPSNPVVCLEADRDVFDSARGKKKRDLGGYVPYDMLLDVGPDESTAILNEANTEEYDSLARWRKKTLNRGMGKREWTVTATMPDKGQYSVQVLASSTGSKGIHRMALQAYVEYE
jgi:hypothetical protein